MELSTGVGVGVREPHDDACGGWDGADEESEQGRGSSRNGELCIGGIWNSPAASALLVAMVVFLARSTCSRGTGDRHGQYLLGAGDKCDDVGRVG